MAGSWRLVAAGGGWRSLGAVLHWASEGHPCIALKCALRARLCVDCTQRRQVGGGGDNPGV